MTLIRIADGPLRLHVKWERGDKVSTIGWWTDNAAATVTPDPAKPDFADLTLDGTGTVTVTAQGRTDNGETFLAVDAIVIADTERHGEIEIK